MASYITQCDVHIIRADKLDTLLLYIYTSQFARSLLHHEVIFFALLAVLRFALVDPSSNHVKTNLRPNALASQKCSRVFVVDKLDTILGFAAGQLQSGIEPRAEGFLRIMCDGLVLYVVPLPF
jgi:hypothetical protein